MDLKQIKELMSAMGRARMKKLALKQGDFEIKLERESPKGSEPASVFVHPPAFPSQTPMPMMPSAHQAIPPAEPQEQKDVAEPVSEGIFITSPMVGTFYKSPSPDADNFVKEGDSVSEDSVVCIIEAMKVMNEVKAGKSGVIKEILIEDGQPVEFGTKLFRIG